MTILQKLLPQKASNDFKGSKIALYGMILFTILMTCRSLIHLIFEDGGLNVIGNLIVLEKTENGLDPNILVYAFAHAWGLAQLIICLINIVVLFRYRNLIPLMYLFWIIEWGTRFLFSTFNSIPAEYYTSPPPGVVGAPFSTILLIVLFIFSLKQPNQTS